MTDEDAKYEEEKKEYEKAEAEVIAMYEEEGRNDNPFKREGLRYPDDDGKYEHGPIGPKAAAKLHDLLMDMHACYNIQMDGMIETKRQAQVVIEHMHEFLDQALDVLIYTCIKVNGEVEQWDLTHEDEPRPDWLD